MSIVNRQKKFREARQQAGFVRIELWINPNDVDLMESVRQLKIDVKNQKKFLDAIEQEMRSFEHEMLEKDRAILALDVNMAHSPSSDGKRN